MRPIREEDSDSGKSSPIVTLCTSCLILGYLFFLFSNVGFKT